jgi:hypothetical protein
MLHPLFSYDSKSSHELCFIPCSIFFLTLWCCSPVWAMASFLSFLVHTQHCCTFSRTCMDKRSAHCRDLYLTTHNTHKKQTSIPQQDSNPQSYKVRAADLHLRPHGHWECPMPHMCLVVLFHTSFLFSFHENFLKIIYPYLAS